MEGRTRPLPRWARLGGVAARAVHILASGVLLGLFLHADHPPGVGPWFALAGVSGLLLLAYEWAAHVDQWRQVSGWALLVKLALLGFAKAIPGFAFTALAAATLISGLFAHLPRDIRHRRLW